MERLELPRAAMAPERPELSLVFPAFDEEANVGPLLDTALALAPKLASDFEIILVDDGSRDATGSLAAERSLRDPRIRVVRHAANRGYGAALRSGLREARGELVFVSDADLQFDLSELGRLLAHARDFDIVAGYRSPRRDPFGRLLIAIAWGLVVRALFGLDVRDIGCAFKVFRRHVIESMPIASIGAFVNTEILVRARAAGHRIHQIPVAHRPRRHGRQTGASPRVLLRAVVELARLHRELRAIASTTAPAAGLSPEE